MATQTNNLLLLPSDGITRTIDTASDSIEIGVNTSFTSGANVVVSGNLTVTGTTFTTESETVLIADNHLYLNDGYTANTPQTGGLVVNYDPTVTTTTVAAGGFTAGVAAVSNPTVVVAATVFAVGDLIQISGAANRSNDGLYEVLDNTTTTMTIRGIGLTATQEDFTQNQFVTDATVAGSIYKVNVSVMRAGTDGLWEYAVGSASPAGTPLVFTDFATGGTTTLQSAYENGNTITTSAPEGNITFTGTEDFLVTLSDVDMDVSGTITLDATTTITIGGDNDTSAINIGTSASARTITIGNATGATTMDLNSGTGGVTVDTTSGGTISLDAIGAASNFSVATNGSAQDLTLSVTGATDSSVVIDSSGTGADAVDINATAGGITVDAVGALSLDSTGTASNLTLTANDAGTATLTIEVTNAGAGAGDLDINADNAITVDGASFSVDGTSNSNVSVTGGNLVLSTITSGTLELTSAGLVDLNAGANLDVDVTGTVDILATSTFSIDGTGNSNVSATSGNLVLSTITSGTLELTSAGDMDINGPDNSASAIGIDAGGLDYITIDSTNSAEQIIFHQDISLASGVGFTYDFLVGSTGITVGDLVAMEYGLSARVITADANDAQEEQRFVVGVAKTTTGATGTGKVHTVQGQIVPVTFGAAPAAADNGKRVYLSTTPGQATLTAPTSASTNVFQVGILIGGDGASNPANILFIPQFIARRP